jgi:hypothetical protein
MPIPPPPRARRFMSMAPRVRDPEAAAAHQREERAARIEAVKQSRRNRRFQTPRASSNGTATKARRKLIDVPEQQSPLDLMSAPENADSVDMHSPSGIGFHIQDRSPEESHSQLQQQRHLHQSRPNDLNLDESRVIMASGSPRASESSRSRAPGKHRSHSRHASREHKSQQKQRNMLDNHIRSSSSPSPGGGSASLAGQEGRPLAESVHPDAPAGWDNSALHGNNYHGGHSLHLHSSHHHSHRGGEDQSSPQSERKEAESSEPASKAANQTNRAMNSIKGYWDGLNWDPPQHYSPFRLDPQSLADLRLSTTQPPTPGSGNANLAKLKLLLNS